MENIHGGHRDRMRSCYLQEGPDGFADHELLEMLLWLYSQRGHKSRCTSAAKGIRLTFQFIESDAHEIAKTEGVGLKSAIFSDTAA